MTSNKTQKDRLTNAKNVARGAIASLRQTVQTVSRRGDEAPIKRTTGWNARQATTFQLNKAIAQARSGLSKNDLQEFNQWLNEL